MCNQLSLPFLVYSFALWTANQAIEFINKNILCVTSQFFVIPPPPPLRDVIWTVPYHFQLVLTKICQLAENLLSLLLKVCMFRNYLQSVLTKKCQLAENKLALLTEVFLFCNWCLQKYASFTGIILPQTKKVSRWFVWYHNPINSITRASKVFSNEFPLQFLLVCPLITQPFHENYNSKREVVL